MPSDTWYLRHNLFLHISILENIWRISLLRILTLYTITAVSLISLTPNRKNLYYFPNSSHEKNHRQVYSNFFLNSELFIDTWYLNHNLNFHINIFKNTWRHSLSRILILYTTIAVGLISLTLQRKNL